MPNIIIRSSLFIKYLAFEALWEARRDGLTDPEEFNNDELKELPYNGVYKLSYSGSLSLIIDDLSIPNGIAISNDQKTLYVNVSDREDMKIMAYDEGGLHYLQR